ncbi:MAG TPA: hypothetical protein VFJ16_08155 [Longimicrobium sp.]|nr:hypothetical protein [Longimicrobium sp.]
MTHRPVALAALSLAGILGCGPRAPSAAAPPAAAGEFRDTHHTRLRGTVVDGRGAPLDSVVVQTLRLENPALGSLAYNRAMTAAGGSFTLPVELITNEPGIDTATARVVVRAVAFPPRYPRPSPDRYYTAEATVTVRVVPARRPAETYPVRLVLPLP